MIHVHAEAERSTKSAVEKNRDGRENVLCIYLNHLQ